MNNNQTNQQQKVDHKGKVIGSLVFGGISIILNLILVVHYSRVLGEGLTGMIGAYLSFFSLILGWLFPIVGLILGILGLKSTKKKLAITGIILSLIGLAGYIYIFSIALRLGTG